MIDVRPLSTLRPFTFVRSLSRMDILVVTKIVNAFSQELTSGPIARKTQFTKFLVIQIYMPFPIGKYKFIKKTKTTLE